MNDQIPSIDSDLDRSTLNIGGFQKKNKTLIIGSLLLIGFLVIVSAVSFALVQLETPELPPEAIDTNYNAGLDQSSLNDSEDYFAAMGEAIKRKKALETEIAIKKAEVIQSANQPLQETEVIVQRSTPHQSQPPPQVKSQRTPTSDLTPEQRKLSGSVMVSITTQNSSVKADKYNESYRASKFEPGSARLREAGTLDHLLIHGTAIPCVLYTQIISDYEGFVTCRVSENVYSANGSTLLVERGSLVSGTQEVAMELGKARVFTNWADIETPLGVSIRIDSLGTGALGASGHQAWVDNHFSERFGGAILLSFVDDALGALSANASNEQIQYDNSTENAGDMAAKALDANINIAPTGYAHIGQRINILVARDIDLSGIYGLTHE